MYQKMLHRVRLITIFRINLREQPPLPRRINMSTRSLGEFWEPSVQLFITKNRYSSLQLPYILLLIAFPYTDYIGMFVNNQRP